MKLYYFPGACSLAPHIVLREAGLDFELENVDLGTKKTGGGADFLQVNPKGYVPALQLDDGQVLTEDQVILQYLADLKPEAGLMPPAGTFERYRLLEWLAFISTEIHKTFGPFWNPESPEASKKIALALLSRRLDYVEDQLAAGGPWLMGDRYGVADAYLFTVLGWCEYLKIDLSNWPRILAYLERNQARPAVQAAMKAEGLTG
ncbi:glutathione transferase GstA [Methylococcus sp. ANG]|uniref:glutathione transferase GstA n=1 Tax=unclassified Methylococcus TaxID=2618889 RepID=UPI001C52C1F4|nr:glutathione transferase GstA [Methylococcus sp. Mc7]QXP85273.1 glutathione transferase GstA [Methylococcus sp. Mc7]